MIRIIKRKTDGKYLKSFETDLWVSDLKSALEMSFRECEMAKKMLQGKNSEDEFIEIINFSKMKNISKEEKEELYNMMWTKK